MKTKPVAGQVLYSLNVGNAARGMEQVLTPVTVVSVGRKYFKVKKDVNAPKWCGTEYHIEDWREKTECTVSSRLYESEQEWADEKEANAICKEMSNYFEWGMNSKKLPLESLRKIVAIIKEVAP